ncbi:uncharacterized protein [Physcomitrium patens]|uniref:Late embryogenesis abundant protein LEA-2 subgroup domain-containing protein n=1 Tax=Physcomitrium patens TaxID=3218 RepID=A0A2K1J1W2_PHYPA|nr:uncharacterized protein LOC112294947 [Physcomitrium patens]PNR35512.1 hypothetical protein PHYPA_023412 [Physcomitrium patens]|eukprot:XP_024401731.1 uncharacterized protein LOC112294947 [Physcomitrella patens]
MGYSEMEERAPIVIEERRYYVLPTDAVLDLPLYRPRRRVLRAQTIIMPIIILFSCLLLAGTAFVLWPAQPQIELEHWKLVGINFDTKEEGRSIIPVVYLNISLDVVLKIKNPNFVGIYYDFLDVEIQYRGSYLGNAQLKGGHILARRTVLVPAILNLEAREILENASELLMDIAHGEIPLTNHIKIVGAVDLQVVRPHIDVHVSCDVVVDPKTKLVIRQYCGLDFLYEGTHLQKHQRSVPNLAS